MFFVLPPNGQIKNLSYLRMSINVAYKESSRALTLPRFFKRGRPWLWLFILLIAGSLAQIGIGQRELFNPAGLPLTGQFFAAAFAPARDADILALTFTSSLITLAYAVCGVAVSLVIGIGGGILSSEVWWLAHARGASTRAPWVVTRALLAAPRAMHEVIWGLFFINLFGLDPLVAILALGIPFGATTAKVYGEILDETPRAPLYALLHAGTAPHTAFLYTLLPQAAPQLLSYAFYRFECALRAAAVLGLIGAGGLGFQILLSLQALNYDELWTFLYALCVLSALTDLWSSQVRLALEARGAHAANSFTLKPRWTSLFLKMSLLAALLLIPGSFIVVAANFGKLVEPRTFELLADLAARSVPPNLDAARLPKLFFLAAQTLAMSALAIALAGGIGILTSYFAARNLMRSPFERVTLILTRALLLLWRAIPAPIWALLCLFVFFPGILPGAIAIAIHNAGVLGRLMAETIENANARPLRALTALGAPKAQAVLYGVMPLTLPQSLAYTLYRWEVGVRETVVVGMVGAGGLGLLLQEQLSSFDYRGIIVTLFAFFVLTFIVDVMSASARKALR